MTGQRPEYENKLDKQGDCGASTPAYSLTVCTGHQKRNYENVEAKNASGSVAELQDAS